MKKFWLLSQFTLLALAAPAFGDDGCTRPCDTNVQKSYFGKKPECTSCCEPEMNYRLPADYWGVDTFVEYLLWQVQEQASHFVVDKTPSTFDKSFPVSYALGTIRSEGFDWNSGVRAGFGYSFGRDVWQLLGEYTWYNTEGQRAYTVQTPLSSLTAFLGSNYLMPTLNAPSFNGEAKASSSATFNYQMFDLMLASAFLATEQIQFNYSFGTAFGRIRENWNVRYTVAPTPIVDSNTYWHNHWTFGGGGFRAGIDTNWHVGRGFGIFGKVYFSALLGQYKNRARVTLDSARPDGSGMVQQHSTYKGIMLLPTTQFVFGFDWCRTYTNCWVSAFKLSVAAEFNHLSDLQQVFKTTFINSPNQDKPTSRDIGSVYMYGGTARVGVDY